jgi:hypothetical protein
MSSPRHRKAKLPHLKLLSLKSILIKQRSRSTWINQRISLATTRRDPQASIGTVLAPVRDERTSLIAQIVEGL